MQHNIITLNYIDSKQSEGVSAVIQGGKTGVLMAFTTMEKNPNKNFMSKCLQQMTHSEHVRQ